MKFGSFVVLGVLGACGEVSDPNKLPDAPLVQDGPGSDADIDAPLIDAPPPRCDPSKPFGTPAGIPEIASAANDTTPWLTADELSIYFASSRPGGVGGFDIYLATRTDPTAAWGTPAIVAGVNTANAETHPTVTGDGLTMYAVQVPVGTANSGISVATRTAANGSFGALSPVTALNDADVDGSPYVLADHSALWMTSRRGGANNVQIFRATRTNNVFAAPTLIVGTMLDVFDEHSSVAVTPDELTLYFGSDRTGGAGGIDVWVASRASLAVGFGLPTAVTELNSTSTDVPYWISPDGCVLYGTKLIVGTSAAFTRIFVATKPL